MACDKSRTWRKGKVGLRHAHNKSLLLSLTRNFRTACLLGLFSFLATYFLYQSNLHGAFSLIVASIHPWLPHSHGPFP